MFLFRYFFPPLLFRQNDMNVWMVLIYLIFIYYIFYTYLFIYLFITHDFTSALILALLSTCGSVFYIPLTMCMYIYIYIYRCVCMLLIKKDSLHISIWILDCSGLSPLLSYILNLFACVLITYYYWWFIIYERMCMDGSECGGERVWGCVCVCVLFYSFYLLFLIDVLLIDPVVVLAAPLREASRVPGLPLLLRASSDPSCCSSCSSCSPFSPPVFIPLSFKTEKWKNTLHFYTKEKNKNTKKQNKSIGGWCASAPRVSDRQKKNYI